MKQALPDNIRCRCDHELVFRACVVPADGIGIPLVLDTMGEIIIVD